MEAHRSYERFEQGHEVAHGRELPHHAPMAAVVVAVIACFLAMATFLSDEAVKEVITGETHGADASTRLESNRVKIDIANGNSSLLRILGAPTAAKQDAVAKAREHEARIAEDLRPTDAHLNEEIAEDHEEVDHADTRHLDFELAEVGFEVGIVLASISIIARRRWLLVAAGGVATAGVALLLAGAFIA